MADCVRMPAVDETLILSVRRILRKKGRLNGLVALVHKGQWSKFLKALQENGLNGQQRG